jgi:alanine dehydrogenase
VVLPKPTQSDVKVLREGQVLWGWPHCVQDAELTQLAIDQRLTLIAWEAMNHWTSRGVFDVHVFHGNNELAGYCSVLHALSLVGSTSHYGRRLTAAVIGFGNSARGAVTGLGALGVNDVTVLTMRETAAVASPIPSATLQHLERSREDPSRTLTRVDESEELVPTAQFLAGFDIVVNCVLQNTDAPMMFVMDEELEHFAPGTLFIDVSCDEGMGFESAKPTSFEEPLLTFGHGVRYYGVDHTPSYLWNSATWEISCALIPFLRPVMEGPSAWEASQTIRRAIEIRDGVIQNPKILGFQHRSPDYPHPRL